MSKGQSDVVESFYQTVKAEIIYGEGGRKALGVLHRTTLKINGRAVTRLLTCPPHQLRDLRFGKHDGHDAVLHAVVRKYVGERWRDDGAKAIIQKRPRRVLARRAASEISACHEDRRALIAGRIQNKRGVQRAACGVAPIVEQEFPEARALDALQELLRNDLIRINIRAVERRDYSTVNAKRFHNH